MRGEGCRAKEETEERKTKEVGTKKGRLQGQRAEMAGLCRNEELGMESPGAEM